MRVATAMVLTVLLGACSTGQTQEHKLFPRPSTASLEDHTQERAGMPNEISRWAKPSIEKHEGDGLVGGSRLFHGDGPGQYDGTFSWDYQGFGHFPGRVFLSWSHDRAHQPKFGPYKTDTYRVPDPVSLHPIRRLLEPRDP